MVNTSIPIPGIADLWSELKYAREATELTTRQNWNNTQANHEPIDISIYNPLMNDEFWSKNWT